ncbi:MAG: MCE family protein [Victivallales bacterium]|nr:MCE family protein [Victivallales bacterium]
MSNSGNKYKVGMLVFFSFLALLSSLLSLGITKYFRKTFEFMTVVNSSVQGLDKGAKVKFKGVTVGSVRSIKIDSHSESNNIFIFMEFDPKAFIESSAPYSIEDEDDDHPDPEMIFRKSLAQFVDKGLRCQLQYLGITGNQYIEISYFDPAKHPVKEITLFPGHPPYLPSIESASVTNILEEVQEAVTKIAKIDFEKISAQIDDFLSSANKLVKDKNTIQTMQDLREISANLKLLTSRLNRALDEKRISEISEKLDGTISNINQMVISTRALVEYLEKNPESVIRGKSDKPIVAPK